MDLQRYFKLASYKIGDCTSSEILGIPHIDISSVYDKVQCGYFGQFDKSGVPTFDLGKSVSLRNTNSTYSFHLVALYALATVSKFFQTRLDTYRLEFLNLVNWMLDNQCNVSETICWKQKFDLPLYGLKSPWSSGLIQGRMLSNLSRAYQITNRLEYLECAYKVYRFLLVHVKDGGVKVYDSQHNLWFEEYPSKTPSLVLNGFIFTLFGLHDYFRITRSEEVRECIECSISTVKNSLHKYDSGFWTTYDQYWRCLTSFHYHVDIHSLQMKALYEMTTDPLFLCYYLRWKQYSESVRSKIVWSVLFPILGIRKRLLVKCQRIP